jgi:hypothetical protein
MERNSDCIAAFWLIDNEEVKPANNYISELGSRSFSSIKS